MRPHSEDQPGHECRRGFTLVELLVVLAVVGLLIALILPAIQASRGAARRARCASNLRQFGIALNAYASLTGFLPYGHGRGSFSLHVSLLPYLDQKPLYDSLNVQFGGAMSGIYGNWTAQFYNLEIFLCPSDRVPPGNWPGWTSYAGNRGVGYQKYGYNGTFATAFDPLISLASITDGTSQTAVMAEWLLGLTDRQARDARRSTLITNEMLWEPEQFDQFARACHDLDPATAGADSLLFKGMNWMRGEFSSTLYNHTLGINDHTCTNNGAVQEGAYTVGSLHPGGAHTLFVDGHLSFLRDSMSLAVWRAIGSRNGGEMIADPPN